MIFPWLLDYIVNWKRDHITNKCKSTKCIHCSFRPWTLHFFKNYSSNNNRKKNPKKCSIPHKKSLYVILFHVLFSTLLKCKNRTVRKYVANSTKRVNKMKSRLIMPTSFISFRWQTDRFSEPDTFDVYLSLLKTVYQV